MVAAVAQAVRMRQAMCYAAADAAAGNGPWWWWW
jgi:hypothetical protein